MPLTASTNDGRAWAMWVRQLRLQIAFAKAAGNLGDTDGPQEITDRLLAIIAEVQATPTTEVTVTIHAVDWPGYQSWAHYHRVVVVWAADLRTRGVIGADMTPAAARFSDALIGYAELSKETAGPPLDAFPLAGTVPPTAVL